LFTGAGRIKLPAAAAWFAILAPCLLFTYTRSAYLGLLAGIAIVCITDSGRLRRHAAVVGVALTLVVALLLFGGTGVRNSDIGQRFQSIFLQTDLSSTVHKERMARAVDVIEKHPFGIGLGAYGTVQARFVGGSDVADWAENAVLQVTVETGLVGGFAYLAFTATVLVALLRPRHRRNEEERLVAVCAGAVLVAMTLIGMVLPVWDEFFPLFYAWTLAGLAMASGCAASPREIPAQAGLHFT
jgi:O-antigen ligase